MIYLCLPINLDKFGSIHYYVTSADGLVGKGQIKQIILIMSAKSDSFVNPINISVLSTKRRTCDGEKVKTFL